jgi:ADP-heptose:LPS heptosyltransferase
MERILVLRGGALGDFIVTLPALSALRQRWPRARIHLVGNRAAAALAIEAGLIDTVASQHAAPWHRLFAPELTADFRAELAAFDLVINFWPDPDGTMARHLPVHARQRYLSAAASPAVAPAAVHFVAALRVLGIAAPPPVFALRATRRDARFIALHPGSGSARKNWPAARWRELAAWLETRWPGQVRVIRGEAEPPDLLAEAGAAWADLPLPRLADHLACCRFFIGHDSGISHLAAACGCAGLLLFGPTDPAMWAPPAAGMRVLRNGPCLYHLTVRDVRAAVAARLTDQT